MTTATWTREFRGFDATDDTISLMSIMSCSSLAGEGGALKKVPSGNRTNCHAERQKQAQIEICTSSPSATSRTLAGAVFQHASHQVHTD